MIESDLLFPWLSPNLHALRDSLNDVGNCEAMYKVRQVTQFLQRHPVASVFLGTLVITGFLPFFLFLAFVVGSSVFVLFTLLLLQGGVLAIAMLCLLGVFVPIVMFGTKLTALVCFVYIITMTALHVVQVLTNQIVRLPSRILIRLNQKIHDIVSRFQDAVGVEMPRRGSSFSYPRGPLFSNDAK